MAHFHKGTGWVEGPSSTGQQVCVVIGVQQLHKVHALRLVGRWERGGAGGGNQAFPRETPSGVTVQPREALTGTTGITGTTGTRVPCLLSDKSCLSSQGGYMRKYTYAQPSTP